MTQKSNESAKEELKGLAREEAIKQGVFIENPDGSLVLTEKGKAFSDSLLKRAHGKLA